MNNLQLLDICINNPESPTDPFYSKINLPLTISENIHAPKTSQLINKTILRNIDAVAALLEKNEPKAIDKLIYEIFELIELHDFNNTEFVSFWAVNDVSFSLFQKFSAETKIGFLKQIIPLYIHHRHFLYKLYGYSDVTLQVLADSFAHKASGSQAIDKVKAILQKNQFLLFNSNDYKDFLNSDKVFAFTDQSGRGLFDSLVKFLNLRFVWGKNHENKRPDIIIRRRDQIFIVEAKHMKETGGGQDKQVSEIIKFIDQKENNCNVSYVTFLDGIYFNKIFKVNSRSKKTKNSIQAESIRVALKNHPRNFFVNTHGFKRLFS